MDILDELIDIMNYDGTSPEIQNLIEDLNDTELSLEQKDLIFYLAGACYELGVKETENKDV